MLLSSTDEDVLAAAEALGEELAASETDASERQFESLLVECNEAITEETGIKYGEACDAGDCC
ncbi:halo-CC-star protein HcsS [Natronoarchaeum sp. GCM10025703]|uniref:halo-CC-star protein HcsS n=1 Tax=unclassified Natronoarchaeum TaxID=2620183 RepID=UPI0036227C8A